MPDARRWAYLHGLATGPASTKGTELARRLSGSGIVLELLDLRLPNPDAPRLDAMTAAVWTWLDGLDGPTCLIGASFGGLVALHVTHHPRVAGLLLLAPAVELADLPRRQPLVHVAWRRLGALPFRDKLAKQWRWIAPDLLDDSVRRGPPVPPEGCPTFIVHGTRDRMVPVAGSRRLAARTPHARLTEVHDGHDLLRSLDVAEALALRLAASAAANGPSAGDQGHASFTAPGVP
jgi:hypothetical protein